MEPSPNHGRLAHVTAARHYASRLDNVLAAVGSAKRIYERGEVSEKLEADAEWVAFQRKVANDPPGETLSTRIVQEFELPR